MVFDGVDLGWHYTSSLNMNVTHDLTVVQKTSKGVSKKSSPTSLSVGSIGKIELGDDAAENDETYFALSASPDETLTGAVSRVAVDVGSCQPADHLNLWDYNDNLVSRVSKPDDCFRVTVDHGLERNYLDAYTVELEPIGGDVNGSWGEIAWDAWEELTCEAETFTATDELEVGICELFEAEVDRLPTPKAVPVVQNHENATGADNVTAPTLAGFNLTYADAADNRHNFTAMWYDRKRKNDARNRAQMPPPNLFDDIDQDEMGVNGRGWCGRSHYLLPPPTTTAKRRTWFRVSTTLPTARLAPQQKTTTGTRLG